MRTVRRGWVALLLLTAVTLACGESSGRSEESVDAEPNGSVAVSLSATSGSSSPTPTGTTTAVETASATVEPSAIPSEDPPSLALELVAEGFERPTFVTHAGDGSGRLFVVEKQGRVLVLAGSLVLPEPFLDITDRVDSSANERGLLGLAFDPDFARNGLVYVTYTRAGGSVTLSAFSTGVGRVPGGTAHDERVLLEIAHPRSNHNGGMIAFGPDGYLYLGTGDGGGAGDPDGAGQDLSTLAGKILRLDVGEAALGRVSAAAENPFLGVEDARPEVWALGLRNPWRFSFDRLTGDLWIGDVGQDRFEEVDFQPATGGGGENYGWSTFEGESCFRPPIGCVADGLTAPVHQYEHGPGCSITGGYVYRGRIIEALRGAYLFGDYCDDRLFALVRGASGELRVVEVGRAPETLSSFGEDEAGELYAISDGGGAVWRIVSER